MRKIVVKRLLAVLICALCILSGCQPAWQIDVDSNGNKLEPIQPDDLDPYLGVVEGLDQAVRLEQLLYHLGFRLIDQITFVQSDGSMLTFPWEEVYQKAILTNRGEVAIGEFIIQPDRISIKPSPKVLKINLSIVDLAPTMANAIGLPKLTDADGSIQYQATAKHGVLIMVDGLQYIKLTELMETMHLEFFSQITNFHKGLTVYPPMTRAATAALLTGQQPENNGVKGYGIRDTSSMTLFDLAVENGKSVIAVEGYAMTFNLRNAEVILSNDAGSDGFTDDDVLANSLQIIHTKMPDLLFIHFHDIDDMGHSYGPESLEYQDAILRIDQYLSELIEALPLNTFVIILADHGMHSTDKGGNHGHLIASDMLIPIIFIDKK